MLPRSISSMYQVAPTTTSTFIDIASYFSRKTHFQLSDQRELVLCKFEEKSRRNKFLQISELYEVAPKLLLQSCQSFVIPSGSKRTNVVPSGSDEELVVEADVDDERGVVDRAALLGENELKSGPEN